MRRRSEILTVVQRDDVEAVEQLSFILVNPLHLDVEHGVGVDLHLVLLLQVGGKFHFVLLRAKEKQIKRLKKE